MQRRLMKGRFWRIAIMLALLLVLINVLTFNHAWQLTHFAAASAPKTARPEQLSLREKLSVLFTGLQNPKPRNTTLPANRFEKVTFSSQNGTIRGWLIRTDSSRGIVVMCHGYTSTKSQLLDESAAFNRLGFSTLLIDLSGHGESDGNATTIGYREAGDVTAAYRFIEKLHQPILLYGVSMGAAAILRSVAVHQIKPAAILIECPFGSMLQAVENRFHLMRIPSFPLARLMVFWGSIQNSYPAFRHNPIEYAATVKMPALLMYGLNDQRVTRPEIDQIYRNLAGPKQLICFEGVEHESYYRKQPEKWRQSIQTFLAQQKIMVNEQNTAEPINF